MRSEILTWTIIGICLLVILLLSIKLWLLQKSADEIAEAFSQKLEEETNTLLDICSKDKHMTHLAAEINRSLRKLRSQRHKFEQGDLAVKETITNISHDLRTPLTAIFGYLELLKKENISQETEDYLAVIEERANALKSLTEELFRYSLITSSSEDTNFEPVVLNRQLEESLSGCYAALTGCHIQPVVVMPETKVIRMLNSSALSRIIGNILSNAIKYSDGDLRITLCETGEITFENHASEMDSVQTARLFDRFYTVKNAKNSTGLGLSIAKILTEQMGGTINASYIDGVLRISLHFSDTPKASK